MVSPRDIRLDSSFRPATLQRESAPTVAAPRLSCDSVVARTRFRHGHSFGVQPQEIRILRNHYSSAPTANARCSRSSAPIRSASAVVVTSMPRLRSASARTGGICSSKWKASDTGQDASFNRSCFNFASSNEGLFRKNSSAYSRSARISSWISCT